MYRLQIRPSTKKTLRKLPTKDQDRIRATIRSLREKPYEGKKLRGDHDGRYAIRCWPYRIIYTIEKKIVTVTVLHIGHRRDAYKKA